MFRSFLILTFLFLSLISRLSHSESLLEMGNNALTGRGLTTILEINGKEVLFEKKEEEKRTIHALLRATFNNIQRASENGVLLIEEAGLTNRLEKELNNSWTEEIARSFELQLLIIQGKGLNRIYQGLNQLLNKGNFEVISSVNINSLSAIVVCGKNLNNFTNSLLNLGFLNRKDKNKYSSKKLAGKLGNKSIDITYHLYSDSHINFMDHDFANRYLDQTFNNDLLLIAKQDATFLFSKRADYEWGGPRNVYFLLGGIEDQLNNPLRQFSSLFIQPLVSMLHRKGFNPTVVEYSTLEDDLWDIIRDKETLAIYYLSHTTSDENLGWLLDSSFAKIDSLALSRAFYFREIELGENFSGLDNITLVQCYPEKIIKTYGLKTLSEKTGFSLYFNEGANELSADFVFNGDFVSFIYSLPIVERRKAASENTPKRLDPVYQTIHNKTLVEEGQKFQKEKKLTTLLYIDGKSKENIVEKTLIHKLLNAFWGNADLAAMNNIALATDGNTRLDKPDNASEILLIQGVETGSIYQHLTDVGFRKGVKFVNDTTTDTSNLNLIAIHGRNLRDIRKNIINYIDEQRPSHTERPLIDLQNLTPDTPGKKTGKINITLDIFSHNTLREDLEKIIVNYFAKAFFALISHNPDTLLSEKTMSHTPQQRIYFYTGHLDENIRRVAKLKSSEIRDRAQKKGFEAESVDHGSRETLIDDLSSDKELGVEIGKDIESIIQDPNALALYWVCKRDNLDQELCTALTIRFGTIDIDKLPVNKKKALFSADTNQSRDYCLITCYPGEDEGSFDSYIDDLPILSESVKIERERKLGESRFQLKLETADLANLGNKVYIWVSNKKTKTPFLIGALSPQNRPGFELQLFPVEERYLDVDGRNTLLIWNADRSPTIPQDDFIIRNITIVDEHTQETFLLTDKEQESAWHIGDDRVNDEDNEVVVDQDTLFSGTMLLNLNDTFWKAFGKTHGRFLQLQFHLKQQ